jgi:anaerobic selenocysteine-containing dehydrogenase
MKISACPLDCFDACEIVYNDGKCSANKTNFITNGSLCKPFAYMMKEDNLEDENLDDTLQKVANILKQNDKKIVYYKGTGNISVSQNIPKIFFEKIKATIAVGSICESAGEAGIEMGRKYSVNPDIKELLTSEVIVVWGRNLTVTSRHIYKLIKDKTFITIDPHNTKIAKLSKIFLQIPPKGDYQLVKQLTLALDDKPLDNDMLDKLNLSKKQLKDMIRTLKGKKVSFLLGIGVQKYKQGAQIIHSIDTFANNFNTFTTQNIGVWYLGDSKYPFDDKIQIDVTNTTPYPSVDFGSYDIVFIQGANPVVSAPNTSKVIKGLKKSFVIFMGTTANDTSKYANIIIPAKTFLQKKDVRTSYGHDGITFSEICKQQTKAISEYEFTKYMFEQFNFKGLLELDEYLDVFKDKKRFKPNIKFEKHHIEDIPLLDLKNDEYYVVTSKYEDTINSQFKYNNYVYINPDDKYKEDEQITIYNQQGKVNLIVKLDKNVQKKILLFYAGNKKVNYLTSNNPSDIGDGAIFQDTTVKIL